MQAKGFDCEGDVMAELTIARLQRRGGTLFAVGYIVLFGIDCYLYFVHMKLPPPFFFYIIAMAPASYMLGYFAAGYMLNARVNRSLAVGLISGLLWGITSFIVLIVIKLTLWLLMALHNPVIGFSAASTVRLEIKTGSIGFVVSTFLVFIPASLLICQNVRRRWMRRHSVTDVG